MPLPPLQALLTARVRRTEAWPHVREIFQSICAKEAKSGAPCCDWVGDGGSGHYTKMVHNGIEYGDMQLCAEAYFLLKHIGRFDNQKVHECFTKYAPCSLPRRVFARLTALLADGGPATSTPSSSTSLPTSLRATLFCCSAPGSVLCVTRELVQGRRTELSGAPCDYEAVFARCVSSLVDERRCVKHVGECCCAAA